MAERKGISSILAKVKSVSAVSSTKKVSSFDRFMATSPLDAEPELSVIAKQVSERSTEKVYRKGLPESAAGSGSRNRLPVETVHRNGPPIRWTVSVDRKDLPKESTETSPEGNNFSAPSSAPLLPDQPLLKTEKQRRLFSFLQANPAITTTYAYLSDALGQRKNTVRDNLNLFEKKGLLEKTVVHIPGKGVALKIEVRSTGTVHRNGPPERSTGTVHRNPSLKIDRREDLSISQERIESTWPTLAATGFGKHQLDQIIQALAELDKPPDRIFQSLDHAEWELEHGKMTDKANRPVEDPCAWVFRSLSRTGYYRRPAGYVSPEEQAIRDTEAEAKALSQARQQTEQTRFEVWRDSLSLKEMETAMKGHPGGPRDAWLRRIWKEQQAPS